MATDLGFRPFKEEILNQIFEALIDIKYSKPNKQSFFPPFIGFPKRKRSRQITLKGIQESKAREEKDGFRETSGSNHLCKNGEKNKRKRDNSYGNENSSAKRIQTDADLLSAGPKFNRIECSGTKLIFRRVDQCSASTSSTLTMQRTPFKPILDSNIPG